MRERGKGEKVIQKSGRLAKHQQRLCIMLRLYEPGSICMFKRQFACISEEGSPPDGVSILQVSRSVFRESFLLVPTARPFLILECLRSSWFPRRHLGALRKNNEEVAFLPSSRREVKGLRALRNSNAYNRGQTRQTHQKRMKRSTRVIHGLRRVSPAKSAVRTPHNY